MAIFYLNMRALSVYVRILVAGYVPPRNFQLDGTLSPPLLLRAAVIGLCGVGLLVLG